MIKNEETMEDRLAKCHDEMHAANLHSRTTATQISNAHRYMVMPLMEGGSCADLVRSHFPTGFNKEIGILAAILYDTLKALGTFAFV